MSDDQLKNSINTWTVAYAMEMAVMDHKIRRLERYIEVLAEKAGVDLEAIRV